MSLRIWRLGGMILPRGSSCKRTEPLERSCRSVARIVPANLPEATGIRWREIRILRDWRRDSRHLKPQSPFIEVCQKRPNRWNPGNAHAESHANK